MANNRGRMILGKKFVINLNYAGGVRKSPGGNPRTSAIRECARGKDLAGRKACFRMTSGYALSDKPSAVKARARYAAKKGK